MRGVGPPTGDPDKSGGNLQQQVEIAQLEFEVSLFARRFGEEHLRTLRMKLVLGGAQRAAGDLDTALRTLAETFVTVQHLDDPDLRVEVGRELGLTLLAGSHLAEANELLSQMLRETSELHGERSAEWASAAEELSLALRARGDLDGAQRLQREALEVSRRTLGKLDPGTLIIDMNLESATNLNRLALPPLGALGSWSHRAQNVRRERVFPFLVMMNWSRPEHATFEFPLEKVREALEETSFELTPLVSLFDSALVHMLNSSHDPAELNEGYVLARRVWDERKTALGIDHPQTLNSMLLVSRAAAPHDAEYAIQVGREAAQASEAVLGRGHVDTLGAYELVANMLESRGEGEKAGDLRRENLRLRAADEGIIGDAQPPIENLSGTLTGSLTGIPREFVTEESSAPRISGYGGSSGGSSGHGDMPEGDEAAVTYEAPKGEDLEAFEPESDLVRRTAHVEVDPAREIAPGERFAVGVYVDCAPPDGVGSGALELQTKPGTTELSLRAWLVVSRHFEIEGKAIQPLVLDLRESTSPRLAFPVRALRPEEYEEEYEEQPEARVLFSYLGWPSGEVRLPVPLAQTAPEPAP